MRRKTIRFADPVSGTLVTGSEDEEGPAPAARLPGLMPVRPPLTAVAGAIPPRSGDLILECHIWHWPLCRRPKETAAVGRKLAAEAAHHGRGTQSVVFLPVIKYASERERRPQAA